MSYAYDLLDRQITVSAPGLTAIALAYDAGGRRTSLADETGTTTYGYDGLDHPTNAAHSVDGTVSAGWDALGRRTGLTTSTGAGSDDPWAPGTACASQRHGQRAPRDRHGQRAEGGERRAAGRAPHGSALEVGVILEAHVHGLTSPPRERGPGRTPST